MGGTSMCSGVSGCTFAAAQHQHTRLAFLKRHQAGKSTALRVSWRCGGACPSSWNLGGEQRQGEEDTGKEKKVSGSLPALGERYRRTGTPAAASGPPGWRGSTVVCFHRTHRCTVWHELDVLNRERCVCFFFLSVLFVLLLCQEFRDDRQYMFVLFPVRLMVPVYLSNNGTHIEFN